MMQSIKEFYREKDLAGIPKHNTHDIADFEVSLDSEHLFDRWYDPGSALI